MAPKAPRKKSFVKTFDDLTKVIDVDDSRGRNVPINMNFVEEGYLTKDTGISIFGVTETTLTHSLFHYKKKDGTSYLLRGNDTKLQSWNFTTNVWDDLSPTYTAGAEFGYRVARILEQRLAEFDPPTKRHKIKWDKHIGFGLEYRIQ